jgi:hypothetical protein
MIKERENDGDVATDYKGFVQQWRIDLPHDATILCIPLSYVSKTSKPLFELALPLIKAVFKIQNTN